MVASAGFRTPWLFYRWYDPYNTLLKPPPGHEFPELWLWLVSRCILWESCLRVPSFTISKIQFHRWALLRFYLGRWKLFRGDVIISGLNCVSFSASQNKTVIFQDRLANHHIPITLDLSLTSPYSLESMPWLTLCILFSTLVISQSSLSKYRANDTE